MDNNLFQRAKANADIVKVAGVKLYGGGHKKRGVCPLCHQGEKSKAYAFEVDTRLQRFRCFACDERGGDVIELEHRLHGQGGETMVDAAKRLAGDAPAAPAAARVERVAVVVPEGPTFSDRMAAEVWRQALPAAGTIVQRYLLNRGISGGVLREALKHLRFHPAVYHSGDPRDPTAYPAMVAQVVTAAKDGTSHPTGGIHVTYLARDGSGKASVPPREPQKKMWGRQGHNGCPGGCVLGAMDGEGPIVTAEGIESTLSLAVLHEGPSRPAAALSLNRLQGYPKLDRFDRFDPDMPVADPERPPFLLPVTAADTVIVGCDHDMSPHKVRVRKPLGGTGDRILNATERAKLCGSLACQAWRRAGAGSARPWAPPLGEDFNDMLRRTQSGRVA